MFSHMNSFLARSSRPTFFRITGTIVLLFVVFTHHSRIAEAQANPIATMAPGTWLEVPNSHMLSVAYSGSLASSIHAVQGPSSLIGSWASAGFDTARDRLYVTGGGHNAYWGNEVYAFDLNSLAWSEIIDPQPLASGWHCPDASVGPCSEHTYDTLEYLPNVDKFLEMGQIMATDRFTYPDWQTAWEHTYLLGNLGTTPAWEIHTTYPYPAYPANSNPWAARLGAFGAYDPTSGLYFYHTANGKGELASYNANTDTWKQYGGGNGFPKETYNSSLYCTAAVDPVDKLFVAVGYQCMGSTGTGIGAWDISNPRASYITGYRPTATGVGVTAIQQAHNPGFIWDSAINKFVAWSGGSTVYTLDPTTWAWTAVIPSSANTVTPTAANPQGTFGRFQYDPKLNVFVVVNATNQDVYIYKPDFNAAPPSNCSVPKVTNTSLSLTSEAYKPLTYTITASDAPFVYWANGLPSGTNLNSATGVISGTPTTIGTYTVHIGAQNICGVSSGTVLTITVISGKHFKIRAMAYPDLQSAINAATSGDTIDVDAGTYVNMYADIKKSVTVQGVGGLAHFSSDQDIPNGKAILLTEDRNTIVLNNIEISGARVSDQNGAGIRYQGGLLKVENSYFHDNENGLMGGGYPAGQLAIVNSVFDHNGQCPPAASCSHGVYIGHMAKATITNSTFRNTNTGHHIKSRALETDISNTLEDDGTVPVGASFAIDIPNAGVANITCNEIIKNPNAQNNPMISYGEEHSPKSVNSLTVTNSLFVNNVPSSEWSTGIDPVGIKNCLDPAQASKCGGYPGVSITAIVSNNTFVNLPSGRETIGAATLTSNTDTTSNPGTLSSCGPIGANLTTPAYVSPQSLLQAPTSTLSL